MLVLRLHGRRRDMTLVGRGFFRSRWTSRRPTIAAVEAGASCGGSDDCLGVNVVDHRAVDVHYFRVVEEVPALPVSAAEANSSVAETVVNAAVEADGRAPVSVVPTVRAVSPAPVAGRPEEAHLRGDHPGARHPIVSVVAIRPVTGRPEVIIARANGLFIYRYRGWSDLN